MRTKKANGRKYTLTWAGLMLTALPVAAIFAIAGFGKVTAEVSQLLAAVLPPYYLAIGVLVAAFHGANAFVSGKVEPLKIAQQQEGQ